MTDDPVRLLDEGGGELLRSLLSAAREEEPEAAALRRTLIAVGVGAALTTTAASASAASVTAGAASAGGVSGVGGTAAVGTAKGAASSMALVVAKWLAIGALTGTVASSAVYSVSGALAPPPHADSSAPVLPVTPVVPQNSLRPRDPVELQEIPRPPAVVSAPVPAPAIAEPVGSQPKGDLGAPLAAEVAALDNARQALRASDAARTLDLLANYETTFPEGRMLPEALYLRLEAFTLRGDKSNAEAVARRILRVYPSSPHAARARAVLGIDK
jgi:hypothetical protein